MSDSQTLDQRLLQTPQQQTNHKKKKKKSFLCCIYGDDESEEDEQNNQEQKPDNSDTKISIQNLDNINNNINKSSTGVDTIITTHGMVAPDDISSKRKSNEDSKTEDSPPKSIKIKINNQSQSSNAEINDSLKVPNQVPSQQSSAIRKVEGTPEDKGSMIGKYQSQQKGLKKSTFLDEKDMFCLIDKLDEACTQQFGDLVFLPSGTSECSGLILKLDNKYLSSDYVTELSKCDLPIPEVAATYLAERLKGLTVIESPASKSENQQIIAKQTAQLIVLDSDYQVLNQSKSQFERIKQLSYVDYMQGDLDTFRLCQVDAIVYKPHLNSENTHDRIDLMKGQQQSLQTFLKQSFEISESVVLILHRSSEKKFAVEIQMIHIDSTFCYAFVFIGNISDVSLNEEIHFFAEKLFYSAPSNSGTVLKDKLHLLIAHLREKIQMRGIALLIEDCEQSIENMPSPRITPQGSQIRYKNASQKIPLVWEFLDRLNEKREERIRSSGNTSFDFEGESKNGNGVDSAMKTLINDIISILKQSGLNVYQRREKSIEGGAERNSSNGSKLDFWDMRASGVFSQKNPKFNSSVQEQGSSSSTQFSPRFASRIKNPKNNNGEQKNGEEDESQKGTENNNNEMDSYASPYRNEENGEEFDGQKVYYSCSYDPCTLLDSEESEANSVRPPMINSNGYIISDGDDSERQMSKSPVGSGSLKQRNTYGAWADGEQSRSQSKNISPQQQQQLLKYIDECQDDDFCLEQEEEEEEEEREVMGKEKSLKLGNQLKGVNSYDTSLVKDSKKPTFLSRIR